MQYQELSISISLYYECVCRYLIQFPALFLWSLMSLPYYPQFPTPSPSRLYLSDTVTVMFLIIHWESYYCCLFVGFFFFLMYRRHLSVSEEAKQNWFHSKQICNFFCRRKCSILFWMDDMFHLDFSANSFCRSPVVFLQATWCHCGWQPSVTIVWSSYGFLGNQLSDSK